MSEQGPKTEPPDGAPPVAEDETGRRRPAFRWIATHRRIILWTLLGTFAVVTAWIVLTWPDVAVLRERNPANTAFIDRYLEHTGRSSVAWIPVPGSRISPYLKEAVVVSEDLEFFSHGGFSAHEIELAIREAVEKREPPRGASTITQQLAKNLWLSPSRNPLRKAKEVVLTRQLEKHLGKNRILELYLNVVEFGPGVYGAEAAARHYFGKSAGVLTPRESAMLAAGLPRPRQWHPGVESASYARRVETVLTRMQQVTFLDRRFGIGGAPEPVPVEVSEPAAPADGELLPVRIPGDATVDSNAPPAFSDERPDSGSVAGEPPAPGVSP